MDASWGGEGRVRSFQTVLRREVAAELRLDGERFVRKMQTTRFRGYSGRSGARLQNRSLTLLRSIGYAVTNAPTGPAHSLEGLALVGFSAGARHAVTQEYGTVGAGGTLPDIVPTPPRKYLLVALEAALTAAGRSRYPTSRPGTYLRQAYPGRTFIIKTKTGKLFLVSAGSRPEQKRPKSKRKTRELVFLFMLVKSTAVPPRLKLRETFKSLAPQRQRGMRAAVRRALAQSGVGA